MASATRNSRVKSREKRRMSRSTSDINVSDLRRRYAMSQEDLARLLDVSLRTVSGLQSGTVSPTQFRRGLVQVKRIGEALAEVMEPAYVGHWLQEPNEMLMGLKPIESIERGQIDLVWQIVEGLRSGSQS